jgi:hypothetical protein
LLLAKAEQSQQRDTDIEGTLQKLAKQVDPEELERAVRSA